MYRGTASLPGVHVFLRLRSCRLQLSPFSLGGPSLPLSLPSSIASPRSRALQSVSALHSNIHSAGGERERERERERPTDRGEGTTTRTQRRRRRKRAARGKEGDGRPHCGLGKKKQFDNFQVVTQLIHRPTRRGP